MREVEFAAGGVTQPPQGPFDRLIAPACGLHVLLTGLRDAVAVAEDRIDEEQDLQRARVASVLLHPAVHVDPERLHLLDARTVREHRFGVLGGQVTACGRSSRLHDDRSSLRTGDGVERPPRAEVLPLEVYRVHLRVVGVARSLLVDQDGAVLPRIPQRLNRFHPLLGHLVPLAVQHQRVVAVLLRRPRRAPGDDVEPDPALGEVVEGRHRPGRHEGVVEARRQRHRDADVLGALRQQRDQRDGIALRRQQPVLERGLHRTAVRVLDHAGVLDQQVVEAGALQRRGQVDEQVAPHPVVTRVASPGILRPGLHAESTAHEPTQMKHSHLRKVRPMFRVVVSAQRMNDSASITLACSSAH